MLGSGGSSKKVIQDAINAALAQASLDPNFSYDEVVTALTIPQYQQMIVVGGITITDTLTVVGTLAVLNG